MTIIVVAGALIDRRGRVLVARRPRSKTHGGLWEFPGGKVEAGELPLAALARELKEELGIGIGPSAAVPVSSVRRTDDGRRLVLTLYAITAWSGDPRPLEHEALDWRFPAHLARLAMPPADRALVPALSPFVAAVSGAGGAPPG